jgi:hypothetical protein
MVASSTDKTRCIAPIHFFKEIYVRVEFFKLEKAGSVFAA